VARMTVGCAGAAPKATPGGPTRTAEKPRDADDGSCSGAIIDANGSIDDAGAKLISPNLTTHHHVQQFTYSHRPHLSSKVRLTQSGTRNSGAPSYASDP